MKGKVTQVYFEGTSRLELNPVESHASELNGHGMVSAL
jgi:hypothetical protein